MFHFWEVYITITLQAFDDGILYHPLMIAFPNFTAKKWYTESPISVQ